MLRKLKIRWKLDILKVWQAISKYESFVNIIQGTLTETKSWLRVNCFFIYSVRRNLLTSTLRYKENNKYLNYRAVWVQWANASYMGQGFQGWTK